MASTALKRKAEKWFSDNGFTANVQKEFSTKIIFNVEKDGITDEVEIPDWAIGKFTQYMKMVDKHHQSAIMLKRLEEK